MSTESRSQRDKMADWRRKAKQCSLLVALVVASLSLTPSLMAATDSTSNEKKLQPACRNVKFQADGKTLPPGKPVFHALESVDLEARLIMSVNPAKGDAGLYVVRFVTPRGATYEERSVPWAEPSKGEKERRVGGHPFPVPVKQVQSEKEGNQKTPFVTVILPVAGTNIVSSSIYGTWTLEAKLEGYEPCRVEFVIAP